MPALILLLFFSLTSFAKQNWCEFDTTFAEKYLEARGKYARHLNSGRALKDPSDYNYGKKRSIRFGENWPKLSVKETTRKFFGDAEIDYVLKENGKMIVYPKGMKTGDKIILMDPSGEYFRIVKGKVSSTGHVTQTKIFYDASGKERNFHPGLSEAENNLNAEQTHFRALP